MFDTGKTHYEIRGFASAVDFFEVTRVLLKKLASFFDETNNSAIGKNKDIGDGANNIEQEIKKTFTGFAKPVSCLAEEIGTFADRANVNIS